MEWLGKAKIAFHHSNSPVSFLDRDGSQTDLLKVCEKVTPPCQLNPFLCNGHLQTMWTATKPRGPQIYYKRKVFDADHKTYKGTFAVDFAVDPHNETQEGLPRRTVYYSEEEWANMGSDDSRPMLIVLHGLSGGSHEVYLRHAIDPLIKDEVPWAICIVNSRGCAFSKITSGVLYNARATWDVRQVVKWAAKTFPNRPLFGLGFSLGANILTNYVGEEGAACRLKAAMVLGNPFNLELCNKALQRTFIGKQLYQRVLGAAMKKVIETHKEAVINHTKLDYEKLQNITYLYEFDREVQCVAWGYPTEEAYYRDASSSDSVLAIRIPFFALNALDDPIAAQEGLPFQEFKQNPYTVLCTTSLGGHLSWFEYGGGRWFSQPVYNYLKHMATQVQLDTIKPVSNGTADVNGTDGPHFDPMRRKMYVEIQE